MINLFIFTKIISVILIGLLLSIGLWITGSLLVSKMYPNYRLQLRHHLFGFFIAVITFLLYCSFSAVSGTISGIQNSLAAVKETIKLTEVLSGNDEKNLLTTINQSVISEFDSHAQLTEFRQYVDLSTIDPGEINQLLQQDNVDTTKKAELIVDNIFNTYLKDITKKLNRTWWGLLIAMIVIQLFYIGYMIYRAEKKGKFRTQDISHLLDTTLYD